MPAYCLICTTSAKPSLGIFDGCIDIEFGIGSITGTRLFERATCRRTAAAFLPLIVADDKPGNMGQACFHDQIVEELLA